MNSDFIELMLRKNAISQLISSDLSIELENSDEYLLIETLTVSKNAKSELEVINETVN
jgi:hypothetical protein